MVLIGCGHEVGDIPGYMASTGYHYDKEAQWSTPRWLYRAQGVHHSSASRKPRIRRYRQLLLPNAPASRFPWPDDVLRYIWELVRRDVHAKLKARLFAEVHHSIRTLNLVAVRGERDDYVCNTDQVGCFGFLVYCTTCGGRRRIVSTRGEQIDTPGFSDGIFEKTLSARCEDCKRPQDFVIWS